jgi:hypothetical protein
MVMGYRDRSKQPGNARRGNTERLTPIIILASAEPKPINVLIKAKFAMNISVK